MNTIKYKLVLAQLLMFIMIVDCKKRPLKPNYGFINNGTYFEGDIKLDRNTKVLKQGRVSVISRWYTWSNAIVPYDFDSSLDNYPYERRLIKQAMYLIERDSCVRFTARISEQYYLRFIRGSGCYSYVGKSSKTAQPVSIGPGCGYLGIILHEIMHSLGFFHTSSRPDRDSYVVVYYNNVLSNHLNDFKKYKSSEVSRQGAPYDFQSILHLPRTSFSKNGRSTILARAGSHISLGQLNGLSPIDIQEVNTLYRCVNNKGCYFSLGMEDKRIPDSWISASSYKVYYEPHQARLHLTANSRGAGIWCASYNQAGQYLLIDLGKKKKISGIATQGKTGVFTSDAWVETYSIKFSVYRHHSWQDLYQTFTGNWDGTAAYYNQFSYQITARYVMVVAQRWKDEICMRVELYGCDV